MQRVSEYLREYKGRIESVEYHFTGSSIEEVWKDGEVDVGETISQTLEFFKQFHRTVSDAGQSDVLEILVKTSLLGEAYYNAVLAWNDGETQMIPSSACFFMHLEKLIKKLVLEGFEIPEEWTRAIY